MGFDLRARAGNCDLEWAMDAEIRVVYYATRWPYVLVCVK